MSSRPENPQEHSNSRDSLRFREAYPPDQLVVREILQEANLSFHSNESSNSGSGEVGRTRVSVCERGGEIVAVGTPEEVAGNRLSRTAPFLREVLAQGLPVAR